MKLTATMLTGCCSIGVVTNLTVYEKPDRTAAQEKSEALASAEASAKQAGYHAVMATISSKQMHALVGKTRHSSLLPRDKYASGGQSSGNADINVFLRLSPMRININTSTFTERNSDEKRHRTSSHQCTH